MKSWKTTLAGIGLILSVIGTALAAQFDNDPNTKPDIEIVIGGLLGGFGLLSARDNKVTSEAAGAK